VLGSAPAGELSPKLRGKLRGCLRFINRWWWLTVHIASYTAIEVDIDDIEILKLTFNHLPMDQLQRLQINDG
jgi:hypothetical protein